MAIGVCHHQSIHPVGVVQLIHGHIGDAGIEGTRNARYLIKDTITDLVCDLA